MQNTPPLTRSRARQAVAFAATAASASSAASTAPAASQDLHEASSASSSSSAAGSASSKRKTRPPGGPRSGGTARRARPLAPAASALAPPLAPSLSLVSSRAEAPRAGAGAGAGAGTGAPPAVAVRPVQNLPGELLAYIASFIPQEKPLAYLAALHRTLRLRTGVSTAEHNALVALRPESFLEIHPEMRTAVDWLRYFRAGGTLDKIPMADRSDLGCRFALEANPRALEHVPSWKRTPALCLSALRRDGYTLAFVPDAHLRHGAPHRQALVDAAWASPKPPRLRHTPADLLDPDRRLRGVSHRPLDLADCPAEHITATMCAEVIRRTPPGVPVPCDAIPARHRQVPEVLEALHARVHWARRNFPPPDWFPAGHQSTAVLRRFLVNQIDPGTLYDGLWKLSQAGHPMTLDLFAAILQADPQGLATAGSLHPLVNSMQAALAAAGLSPGQALEPPGGPVIPWPSHASPEAVWRWAGVICPRQWSELPEALRRDVDTCRQAIAQHPENLLHVPEDVLVARPELIEQALRVEPPARQESNVFSLARYREFAWGHMRRPDLLGQLPAGLWPRLGADALARIWTLAMSRDGQALEQVRKLGLDILTPERVEVAVRAGCDFGAVPPGLQTAALFKLAVRHNGDNLQYLRPQQRSPEWCALALTETISAWRWVPEALRTPALLQQVTHSERSMRRILAVDDLPAAFYEEVQQRFGLPLDEIPRDHQTAAMARRLVRSGHRDIILSLNQETVLERIQVPRPWSPTRVLEDAIRDDPRRVLQLNPEMPIRWFQLACRSGGDVVEIARWLSDNDQTEVARDLLAEFARPLEA